MACIPSTPQYYPPCFEKEQSPCADKNYGTIGCRAGTRTVRADEEPDVPHAFVRDVGLAQVERASRKRCAPVLNEYLVHAVLVDQSADVRAARAVLPNTDFARATDVQPRRGLVREVDRWRVPVECNRARPVVDRWVLVVRDVPAARLEIARRATRDGEGQCEA